ncbi:MAG TPA: PE-PPE domain-containing protein, partial [Mycobacterium sp.]|nr:PE-PPE domain-containing protein [Mycobacterium sp.]
MVGRGCRLLGLGISAVAGASVLGLTSMTGPAFADDTALIVGGSGVPTPAQSYLDATQNLYLNPLGFGSYTPVPVTTPEQYYPLTGVNAPTVDTSVAQGVTALDTAIRSQLGAGNK